MPWTEENIQRVKTLADSGFSATQIAIQIGGVTRNAVVGVGARNNIHFRGVGGRSGPRGAVEPVDPQAPKTRRAIVNDILRRAPASDLKPFMISFEELDRGDCKFPFGDSDFKYCGLPAIEGLPYCQSCTKIAYRPPEHR